MRGGHSGKAGGAKSTAQDRSKGKSPAKGSRGRQYLGPEPGKGTASWKGGRDSPDQSPVPPGSVAWLQRPQEVRPAFFAAPKNTAVTRDLSQSRTALAAAAAGEAAVARRGRTSSRTPQTQQTFEQHAQTPQTPREHFEAFEAEFNRNQAASHAGPSSPRASSSEGRTPGAASSGHQLFANTRPISGGQRQKSPTEHAVRSGSSVGKSLTPAPAVTDSPSGQRSQSAPASKPKFVPRRLPSTP